MEYFIPGFNEQYSIDDKGIVYSNYQYLNNGKKWNRRIIIAKRDHNNVTGRSLNTSVVSLMQHHEKRTHTFFVNSLIVKLFKIRVPDKHHFYDIICKDGDVFNNAIENIGFKIRMEKDSDYSFYPQPFYDSNNKITHKICAVCGIKKDIKYFHFQNPKNKEFQRTYRNSCEPCRAKRQWEWIKSDPERIERFNRNRYNWTKSEKGRAYWKQKGKDRNKFDFENVTPHYVSSVLHFSELGLTQKDLTPELINIVRKRIFLNRSVKQFKIKENANK